MSEFKRANSFGTGYLDMEELYKVKFENKSRKRFFEVAGDVKALEAFDSISKDGISYHYDKEKQSTIGKDGQDYFEVEITTPEGDKMLKTCSKETYLKILRKYGVSSDGRWKEWGKKKDGSISQVKVKD